MNEDQREARCYTIGHSDLPIDAFIYFIKKFNISCIVDVRSTPYSRYQPQFNRENIILSLKKEDIDYQYLGKEVGGRYKDADLLFSDGTVNYQKVSETPNFQKGIDEVVSLIRSGKNISLMCSEKDPLNCHRFVLISRNLIKRGVNVLHICPEVVVKTNKEIEQQMLDGVINEYQARITNSTPNDIDDVYEQQNKKIGFKAINEPKKDQTGSSNITTFYSNDWETLKAKRNTSSNKDTKNSKDSIDPGSHKDIEFEENQLNNNGRIYKKFEQKTLF